MTNRKNTRRALVLSLLSLLLCCSMLVGTTFAWFTDSVTSGNNQIIAGNLDIELDYSMNLTDWNDVTAAGDIFVAPSGATKGLWEPGHTEVAYLRVTNAGTLALKYRLQVNPFTEITGTSVNGDEIKLSEILKFAATEPSATALTAYTRETAQAAAMASTGTKLTEYTIDEIEMMPGDVQYIALVVYMPEEVGNEANYRGESIPTINFGLNLLATQLTYEKDSFDDQYDKDSVTPVPVAPEGDTEFAYPLPNGGYITFSIPREAIGEGTTGITPMISIFDAVYDYSGDVAETLLHILPFDIALDGLKADNTTPITVVYDLPANEEYTGLIKVLHNGVEIPGAVYDPAAHTVTFTITSFSPFEIYMDVGATIIPEDATNDDAIAILSGAKDGAIIDGNGRKITFADNVANKWSFLIQNGVTFRNMTLSAKGDGTTVMVYGEKKTVKMKNVTFENTKSGKKALEISTNARESFVLENCTIKGKAYVQGSNVTFVGCSFNTNMNLEAATGITYTNCTFTASGAITMNSSLKDILFEGCAFTNSYGNAIRLYDGMPQPTNVRLINNTYKGTKFVSPDRGVNYEGWKTAGAWIEEGNVKK